ncbi:MAG TPA: hypothetical protein VN944_09940 [Nitrospiria bacterium]|nr:hypothetical protein [Nitrospiria bacterium]
MKDELENCRGHQVEIMANGISYRGLLIGASEDTISLQTPNQWIEFAMDQVTSIRKCE